MHANQTWSLQRPDHNAYGLDDDDDGVGDFTGAGDDGFGGYGDGDPTAAGRRYLTVQPKQWCTSYVAANRHRYVSTARHCLIRTSLCALAVSGRSTLLLLLLT